MKYTEQKIASFQYELHRWQLVKLTNKIIGSDGILTDSKETHYQIRKDRKVICNVKSESYAKHKFTNMISNELNQLNLFK